MGRKKTTSFVRQAPVVVVGTRSTIRSEFVVYVTPRRTRSHGHLHQHACHYLCSACLRVVSACDVKSPCLLQARLGEGTTRHSPHHRLSRPFYHRMPTISGISRSTRRSPPPLLSAVRVARLHVHPSLLLHRAADFLTNGSI